MSSEKQSKSTSTVHNTAAEKLLVNALTETQQSIRSYDTKAQICAIGYVFSLNIVDGINEALWPNHEVTVFVVLFAWCVLILPMLFFGYVLYPTRSDISAEEKDDNKHIKKILYVRQERYKSIEQLKQAALQSDQIDELSFELMKASQLRDRKRIRFVRALMLAFGAFILMFFAHTIEIVTRLA